MRWDVLLRSTTTNMFVCASVLNTFSCWKSLHYASYPAVLTERASKTPSIFWNVFLTPFFGNVRISMLSLWIMGSSIVKPDYETFTYIYRTEFSIINTRECSFSQKLWNCIEEGSKNENQKWNRPKVMVFQLCTYKAKWSRKLALHDQNQSLNNRVVKKSQNWLQFWQKMYFLVLITVY